MVGEDTLVFAPMHGITLRFFRNALARSFKAPDYAVSPFIATVAGERIKPSLLADVALDVEQLIPVVPQVIGKNPGQLRTMLLALKALGHRRVDLNAGCPWPMVTKKGRGAGLARNADALAAMLETGCEIFPGAFSVKLRLGFERSDELLGLMPRLNGFPLAEVCIHARTAKQMYEGGVHLEAFAEAAAACRHPVVYNGDIFSVEDFARFKKLFPSVRSWMIGRGVLRNPFLIEEIQKGGCVERDSARLRAFADDCERACASELSGPAAIVGRMKELWSYLCAGLPERVGARLWAHLKFSRTPQEMAQILDAFLK